MMHLRLLGLALTALVLSGCGVFSSKPGPKPAELVRFESSVDVKQAWRYSLGEGGDAVLVPAVVGPDVYAASRSGRLVRLSEGREVWKVDTPATITGGVASDGRLVIVGSRQGNLFAYAAADGRLLWKAKATSEILAPAVITSQGVLVRSGDHSLALYGLNDGKKLWMYTRSHPPLALRTHAAPVAAEPYAFVGLPGGKIVGVNLQNGALVWEAAVSLVKGATELERVSDVVAAPLVDGRQTCAVAYQGRVACFDVANGGTLSWARDMSSIRDLAVDQRNIYVSDSRSTVHALERESGNVIWKNDQLSLRDVSAPSALARRGLVVVGDAQGYVHFLSRENGTFAARVSTDGSPIVANPQGLGGSGVLVQTRDGGLYAFEVQ